MTDGSDNNTALLEVLRQFREDYADDQKSAQQSRAAIRQRMEEVVDRLGKMETTAALSGQIDAQVRTELDLLTRKLTDVEPVAVEWNRVKSIGKWAASGLLASGVGIGGCHGGNPDRSHEFAHGRSGAALREECVFFVAQHLAILQRRAKSRTGGHL